MRFSQRAGITPAQKLVQKDSIDEGLRNGLWNGLTLLYWDTYRCPENDLIQRNDYVRGSNLWDLVAGLWMYFFSRPIDSVPTYWDRCLAQIRDFFYAARWYEVYDFVEFIAHYGRGDTKKRFIDFCNSTLERENSAYKFVGEKIAEITSDEEIEAVEEAIRNASPYAGVKCHLTTALGLLANREKPDYRNSIKESISAVEALAKQAAGEDSATLGAILKELERGRRLHPAMRSAFSSLYGYTSDADGIRHALLEEENLTSADARFMLVCCSAFVNYVVSLMAE